MLYAGNLYKDLEQGSVSSALSRPSCCFTQSRFFFSFKSLVVCHIHNGLSLSILITIEESTPHACLQSDLMKEFFSFEASSLEWFQFDKSWQRSSRTSKLRTIFFFTKWIYVSLFSQYPWTCPRCKYIVEGSEWCESYKHNSRRVSS